MPTSTHTHINEQRPLNHFQFAIGGEAGSGVMSVGQMFSALCRRSGKWTFEYPEYPSLISGGHNVDHVLVNTTPARAPIREIHLLIALHQEAIQRHRDRCGAGSGILYDADQKEIRTDGVRREGVRVFPVPIERLSHAAGSERSRNVVAFAAAAGLLNADIQLVQKIVVETFGAKGDAAVAINTKAATLGYEYAVSHFSESFPWHLDHIHAERRIAVSGNTAIALGAVQAGCTFYAAYPMTPSTSILTNLAKWAERYGIVVRHAEDEIGVINEAIGAAYTGVRAMIGTSGGGFALMVEGVGLAAEIEVPLVIVNAQRPGPSTGLPTWTCQADLQCILRSSHGEFPRIILAPGDAQECFALTMHAFSLAEKYQLPVFLLTDKFLGESIGTCAPLSARGIRFHRGDIVVRPERGVDGMFARYRDTPSGVSPRTLPGTPGGIHVANSDEHDEFGITDESADNRIRMVEKRMRKLQAAVDDMALPTVYGPRNAPVTLLTWGSTKGPALDALEMLNKETERVNCMHVSYLHPLPVSRVLPLFRACKKTLLIEGNASGQFGSILKEDLGFVPEETFFKYDGRPFFPTEIVERAERLLASS
jgi:2-oxoglutarate ferredoxin oxidoreductase subunit alpha